MKALLLLLAVVLVCGALGLIVIALGLLVHAVRRVAAWLNPKETP